MKSSLDKCGNKVYIVPARNIFMRPEEVVLPLKPGQPAKVGVMSLKRHNGEKSLRSCGAAYLEVMSGWVLSQKSPCFYSLQPHNGQSSSLLLS